MKKVRNEGRQEATKPSTTPGDSIPGPSGVSQTFSQALTSTKMAIVLEKFPDERLSEETTSQIRTTLTREVFKTSPGCAPKFTNNYAERGVLYITCANNESRSWLEEKVNALVIPDIKLRVGPAKQIVQAVKATVWIPEDLLQTLGEEDPKKIISLLEIQNPGLCAEDIQIISTKKDKAGQTIVLLLGASALKKLREMGLKAYLGLSQLTFRVQGAGGLSQTVHEGHPNKPSTL